MSISRSLLVTGSSGLIGSEVCAYFARRGYTVHGVDNNQRARSSSVPTGYAGESETARRNFACIPAPSRCDGPVADLRSSTTSPRSPDFEA